MDMTLNEIKLLAYTCWNEKHQPLTIVMTKANTVVVIDWD